MRWLPETGNIAVENTLRQASTIAVLPTAGLADRTIIFRAAARIWMTRSTSVPGRRAGRAASSAALREVAAELRE